MPVGAIPYLDSVDESQCANLRDIYIETLRLDGVSGGGSISLMLSAMWTLTKLASSAVFLTLVAIIVCLHGDTEADRVIELENWDWVAVVRQMKALFHRLKTVRIGGAYFIGDGEGYVPFLDALRRAPRVREL